MEKTHILFASGVFPPAIGGPATIIEQLADRLSGAGNTCGVLTFARQSTPRKPYPVITTPLWILQPFKTLYMLIQLIWHARDADILYATDTYTHGFVAALYARLSGTPLILRYTGDVVWEKTHITARSAEAINFSAEQNETHKTKWARDFILRAATTIITDCEFTKNERLLKLLHIPSEKIKVINNAIASPEVVDETYAQTVLQEYGITRGMLLTMSRLVPWKGHAKLITILPAIVKHQPAVQLVIAGNGPERKKLEAQARAINAEYPNAVLFIGAITDQKKKNALYQSARIFLNNTLYEGMSNSLLEAMSHGKAIITSNEGGNPELINQTNGILTAHNDGLAITKAVLELLATPEKAKQLGEKAKETAMRYTWDALVQQNTETIEHTISGRVRQSN